MMETAVKVALAFFVASLALAPALTRDHRKLAAEINTKTLRAAAAVKSSTDSLSASQNKPIAFAASFICRLGTARQVFRLLNILLIPAL